MYQSLLSFFLVFLTYSASATNSCLEDATDSQLLSEIAKRLDSNVPVGNAMLNASCRGWDVTITTVNVDSGVERSVEVDAGGSSKCDSLADRLNEKKSNQILTRPVVVATCSGWDLTRVIINTDGGIKKLAPQDAGGTAKCQAEADRINNRW